MSNTTRRKPSDPEALPTLRRFWALKVQSKAIFAEMDALLDEVIPRLRVGEVLDLGDGVAVRLVDNFAKKNVSWKPCGVRRFELVALKSD